MGTTPRVQRCCVTSALTRKPTTVVEFIWLSPFSLFRAGSQPIGQLTFRVGLIPQLQLSGSILRDMPEVCFLGDSGPTQANASH